MCLTELVIYIASVSNASKGQTFGDFHLVVKFEILSLISWHVLPFQLALLPLFSDYSTRMDRVYGINLIGHMRNAVKREGIIASGILFCRGTNMTVYKTCQSDLNLPDDVIDHFTVKEPLVLLANIYYYNSADL